MTGKIVYKFKKSNVSFANPIDMYLSENYFILAFKAFSKSSGNLPVQQLSVTEFFQSKEESDTVKLLKDFYFNNADRLKSHSFSSFNQETPVVI